MKGRRLALMGAQPRRLLDAVKSRVPDEETLYQASRQAALPPFCSASLKPLPSPWRGASAASPSPPGLWRAGEAISHGSGPGGGWLPTL